MASGTLGEMARYRENTIFELELAGLDACDLAAEKAGRMLRTLRGGRSAFYPKIDVEGLRVGVGVVEKYYYLVYQDTGFACFPMTWALGRVIPLHLPDGSVVFRYCGDVGSPRGGVKRYWYYGADGNLVHKDETKRSWTHPGLAPKNFLRDAAEEAVAAHRDDINDAVRLDIEEEKLQKINEMGLSSSWRIVQSIMRSSGRVVR